MVLASSLSRGDESETNQVPDPMPAIVEAEVDVVIKSTEGKMNIVLNKIKDYVFLEDVWKAVESVNNDKYLIYERA